MMSGNGPATGIDRTITHDSPPWVASLRGELSFFAGFRRIISLVCAIHGKSSLIGICHPLAVWSKLIAPDKRLSGKAAARSEFCTKT
jgi:hypothetical protein